MSFLSVDGVPLLIALVAIGMVIIFLGHLLLDKSGILSIGVTAAYLIWCAVVITCYVWFVSLVG